MKISLDWLNDFIDLKDADPKTLSQQITEHCFEVEKIIGGGDANKPFTNVYIAKVIEWQKHPNADRLRVVKLQLGEDLIDPVVCGAANFDTEDLVALALPGAHIPQNVHSQQHEPYTLGKAMIRGVESQGMICSAFELGLRTTPEEKPEIMVLPKDAPVGMALAEYLSGGLQKFNSVVFDVALPANRPDLFSHLGIAREIGGILGLRKKKAIQETHALTKLQNHRLPKLNLEIQNPQLCPYYIGIRMRVKVGPSPELIKRRLEALGLRSINNVVDITNYVMYELGEPLHAFDAKFVSGGIIVRNAAQGEKFTTLDHKQRELDQDMLVIADQQKTLAIAGIMGGLESEVTESTREIILEAANFDPASIRRTSKKLGLRTDGSTFWEKGLSTEQASMGANRALELLIRFADAELLEFDVAGKSQAHKHTFKFTPGQINGLLGTSLSIAQIKKHLSELAIEVTGSSTLQATVPWYRPDLSDYTALADELLKIAGLNEIPKQQLLISRDSEQNEIRPEEQLKELLVRAGFNEVQNYSFISRDEITLLGKDSSEFVKVSNPLSSETEFLKKDLGLPMLKNIGLNSKNFENIKIFEVGKSYLGYLNEPQLLTLMVYNPNYQPEYLIAELKGALDLLNKYYPGVEPKEFGFADPKLLHHFDVGSPVAYATFETSKLFEDEAKRKYKEISKYPESVLDVSIVVNKDLEWTKIEQEVRANGQPYLQDIQLFEAEFLHPKNRVPKFHKDLAEKGLKNLAFHLVFGSPEKTLKDSEISPIYAKIVESLKSKLNAEIR